MNKKVILLIEDNPDILYTLTEFIKLDGVYEVVAKSNGSDAFQWLSENMAPDVVVTDYHMPGAIKGDIVARAVFRLGIPCLILSASPHDATNAMRKMGIKIPVACKTKCANTIMNIIDILTATKISRETA